MTHFNFLTAHYNEGVNRNKLMNKPMASFESRNVLRNICRNCVQIVLIKRNGFIVFLMIRRKDVVQGITFMQKI